MVIAGYAENFDHACKLGIGAGAPVHRLGGQPDGVNADQRNRSRSQAAQEAAPSKGHFTTVVVLERCNSTRILDADC